MIESAYELIKMIIKNVDPTIQLTLTDGNIFEVPVDPDMLLSELDNDQKQLAEKDAMIDQLCSMQNWDIDEDTPTRCPKDKQPPNDCIMVKHNCANCWRKAAQEAVKKNDNV